MHSKDTLMMQLANAGVHRLGTLLVHSSMKSIGDVDGGAATVLDALAEYMKEGLLVLPTHTWANVNKDNPKFYVDTSPVCVGILPELFRLRDGVVRSYHPTHSVAALGQDAVSFVEGDERWDTPCSRQSVWGKLLDRKATIMLVGVDFRKNTFIHGIEEWLDIPGRLSDTHEQLYTVLGDGTVISVPSRRHQGLDWSEHFWKVEQVLEQQGAIYRAHIGSAETWICDTVRMMDILSQLLKENPALFSDNEPMVL